ncbi:fasciclin domain-containing protein [Sphingomonas sp. PAMC 26621]|uniref:fasciclin domain-containing protein n=1 Tax=Sphingomonas sp. PAMC 26621 TaxID=1112213 RepID=UPI0002899DB7|nr:fasciclin domain-containing protein [Sphingomonas sp. PAMC 26621]
MTLKTPLYLTAMAGVLAIGTAATAQTAPAAAPTAAAPAGQAAPVAPAGQTAPVAPTATTNPTVGGAAMDTSKTIVANASAAPNLSTLVSAVKAAGLATTLAGPGPFTVFAPTNDAFTRLAPGTVDTLMKPANKATLAKVLTYHVVPGTITLADLQQKATAGGGKAVLTTVEGEPLTVEITNGAVQLTDVNGNKSYVETPDVRQSNGVVHVVNGVVLPKLN